LSGTPAKNLTGASDRCEASHIRLGQPAARVRMREGWFKGCEAMTHLHSVPVELLQREIRKIADLINRSVSLDELDRAWAVLWRLQEALALETIRAKSLAD
jgi:pantothenate kinase-related protein Tda10